MKRRFSTLVALLSLPFLLWACGESKPVVTKKTPDKPAAKPAPKPVKNDGLVQVQEITPLPIRPEPKPLPEPAEFGKHPVLVFETNLGPIEMTLDGEKAPKSVENVLKYAIHGFYEGTVFHRIITDYIVQGGGKVRLPDGTLKTKKTLFPPVPNESGNGLKHVRGAVAMARKTDLNSATCQFYIALVEKPYLDQKKYTVFGKVTKGMDVVDKMVALPRIKKTDPKTGKDKSQEPKEPPVIKKVIIRKG